jgi:GTP-binding protein YchF
VLSVGIVGLPNVGKSTLFNALTAGHAEVSNYPFTTIASNVGVVPVPDPRLDALAAALKPDKVTPCAIRFIDIAGLVKGASEGEGLGNQFLGEIRQVDAVAHVVRCFSSTDVAHVFADVDPVRDAEVIETELVLADLEVLDRAIAKRDTDWRTHPQDHAAERKRLLDYRACLERGTPLRDLELDQDARRELKAAGLLTGKPVLYVANGSSGAESAPLVALAAGRCQVECVVVDADLELELTRLEPDERRQFMADLEMKASALDRMIRSAFHLLGLVSFYTVVKSKLQAWEVAMGTPAPQAAGKVHSDMERGFIRAEVASADELCEAGSLHELRSRGHLRTAGKEYEVQDGDVVEFLFHV